MACRRQALCRDWKARPQKWPLLLTAFKQSIWSEDSSSYSMASEDEESLRRAAVAHQARCLANAVTVDAVQRTTEAVLELQNANEVIRTATEALERQPKTDLSCYMAPTAVQCAVPSPAYAHPPTTNYVQPVGSASNFLSSLEQYQQAYVVEGPGAQTEAILYHQNGSPAQIAYNVSQQTFQQHQTSGPHLLQQGQLQPAPAQMLQPPPQLVQPPPQLVQPPPQLVQPPPQLVQPPPQLVQPPPQLVQPPPQLVQPPPQLIQPPPQLVQPPPQLIQSSPQMIQTASMMGGVQCVAAPSTLCQQWMACQTNGGNLATQIKEMVNDATNRLSLQVMKSTAEAAVKTAVDELERIPMSAADSLARIVQREDQLMMDPYYGDYYGMGYKPRYGVDDYDDFHNPYTMLRS